MPPEPTQRTPDRSVLLRVLTRLARRWRRCPTQKPAFLLDGHSEGHHHAAVDFAGPPSGGAHGALMTAVSPAAFAQAIHVVRRKGTVTLVGLPPGEFATPIFEVVLDRITIRGSIVGGRQDLTEAIAMLASTSLMSSSFILWMCEWTFPSTAKGLPESSESAGSTDDADHSDRLHPARHSCRVFLPRATTC
jgi:hypothetical protein